MANETSRIERDSLGDVRVPDNVLYGAQTQRAPRQLSDQRMALPKTIH